jgi:hypothetical protein
MDRFVAGVVVVGYVYMIVLTIIAGGWLLGKVLDRIVR